MLGSLLGPINRERALLFLHARNEGYAREIARFFKTDLDPIQKQLERLEFGNVIYSRNADKIRYIPSAPVASAEWRLHAPACMC